MRTCQFEVTLEYPDGTIIGDDDYIECPQSVIEHLASIFGPPIIERLTADGDGCSRR